MFNIIPTTSLIWPREETFGLQVRPSVTASVKQGRRCHLSVPLETQLLSTGLFRGMKTKNGNAVPHVMLDTRIGLCCPPPRGSSFKHTPARFHLQPQKFISYAQLDLCPGLQNDTWNH